MLLPTRPTWQVWFYNKSEISIEIIPHDILIAPWNIANLGVH